MKKTIGFTLAVLLAALLFFVLWPFGKSKSEIISEAKQLQKTYGAYVRKKQYVIYIDFKKPIFQKRIYVIDTKADEIVIKDYVTHAWNSGVLFASDFSNKPGSNKTCKGAFVTQGTHRGKFGLAMSVKGLQRGVNHNAGRRAIIFHPYSYKKEILSGKLPVSFPWSLGCFAANRETNKEIIELTRNGTLVYVEG